MPKLIRWFSSFALRQSSYSAFKEPVERPDR